MKKATNSYYTLYIFLLLMILSLSVTKAQTPIGYQVGDVVSDFSLKDVSGKMIGMANFPDAKGYFVIFTCNHCPYSQAYESRIMELNQKYAGLGYPVLAISPNDPIALPADNFENMQKLAAEKNYQFPYMIDETQEISRTFGAKATPHVYLLRKTKKGTIVEYTGAIDDDTENVNSNKIKFAENAVKALLAGKKPAVTATKAIGCSIKWKKAY